MSQIKSPALALAALTLSLVAVLALAQTEPAAPRPITLAAPGEFKADANLKLAPGPDDAPIAKLTARFLQQENYRRQKFDDQASSNFLARYFTDLDPQHVHFTQGDLAEFSRYSSTLDELTLRYGDTGPGYEIFARFLERLKEHTAYAKDLLQHEKFDLATHDRVSANRHEASYPQDLVEARKLWRDRLRLEYLVEKISEETPEKTNSAASKRAAKLEKETTTITELAATNAPAKPKTPAEIHASIVDKLSRRYDRVLKVYADFDADDVLQSYLNSLAHTYDPHSDYFGRPAFEDFAMSMNLSLFGIGALLSSDDEGRYCTFKELKPGPAKRSGEIIEGDRIIAVAQGTNEPVDVVEMPLNKVVRLIRGPKDTEVRLTLIPPKNSSATTRKVVTLVREEIKLEEQQAKAKLIELPGDKKSAARLGVIHLPSFYAPTPTSNPDKATEHYTTEDVTKLLVKLAQEKVDGVILDLRHNGGGSLEEAIRLTGLFIKDGPVVQVRMPNGNLQVKADTDPAQLYAGPLFVLTDRFTASASEILAGALQDYGRAIIIGESLTHGKGTVQTLQQLEPYLRGALSPYTTNDPGAIKLTIQKFYRPSGQSTQLKGVVPDIVLPSVNNLRDDIGETADDNALPWDTIAAADYEHYDQVAPFVGDLRARSTARVATNQEFGYVREDIGLYQKFQADKTYSLNQADRLKEIHDNEARAKARDQARAARKTPEPIVHEFTLAQAELPGLPPPVAKTNSVAAKGETSAPSDEVDDEKPAAVDPTLSEAENIFVDYLNLLKSRPAVAVGK
jgi:carboxyl-terminal processing protease